MSKLPCPLKASPDIAQPPDSKSTGVLVAFIACILIWGTTWNAVRLCVIPGSLQPYTAAAVRFAFAAGCIALLWLTGLVRARPSSPAAAFWLTITALMSVVSMALVYNAQRWVSGGIAAIIATTSPLLTALLATLTKTERVAVNSVAGAFVSVCGIALLFSDRLMVSANQAMGIMLLSCSVALNAFSVIILKRHASNEHPLVSVGLTVLVSLISFWILSFTLEQPDLTKMGAVPLAAAAYLGVLGSVVSFGCYFYLLKRMRLMTLSTLVFFPPIIALVVDSLIEQTVVLSSYSYAGIAITMSGVAIGTILRPLFEWRNRARSCHAQRLVRRT